MDINNDMIYLYFVASTREDLFAIWLNQTEYEFLLHSFPIDLIPKSTGIFITFIIYGNEYINK